MYFARLVVLRLSPSLCLRLVSPMWTHMALLRTILPMNASEGISLSRCEHQSHCLCWVRKILNVVSPRLSNANNGTTVLHSVLSYLSTLHPSCVCPIVCQRVRYPPRRRLARVNSPGKYVGRGRGPCASERGPSCDNCTIPDAHGAQHPVRHPRSSY